MYLDTHCGLCRPLHICSSRRHGDYCLTLFLFKKTKVFSATSNEKEEKNYIHYSFAVCFVNRIQSEALLDVV